MKRIIRISMLCLALVAFVCCDKPSLSPERPTSYIFFDSQVDTKGTLVTGMEGRDFGVTAFKYKGYWETFREGQIKPNVFHKQLVEWNGTSHQYDARGSVFNSSGTSLMPWEGEGTLYSFFAYYPYDRVTASGIDVDGEPYIDYTLNHSDMVDVMTSYKVKDVDNSISNSVGFTMKHRLSAIDVHVGNYINDVNGKPVTVRISDLTITFDNLLYSGVSLWMDPEYSPENSAYDPGVRGVTTASSPSASFKILSGSQAVSVGKDRRENITGGENGKTLIVIPQKKMNGSYLKGKASFKFSFVDDNGRSVSVPLLNPNGDGTVDVSSGTRNNVPFDMQKDIDEGQKYYLQLIFMNGLVTMNATSGTYWDDKSINIEFE